MDFFPGFVTFSQILGGIMLKFCAFLLLLPLSALANDDCHVTKIGPTTSVTCSDMQLTQNSNPPSEEVRVEFADGFTLFFQSGSEEKINVALGSRGNDVVTSEDHADILDLVDMAESAGSSSFTTINVIDSIRPNRPLKDNVLFGGEVPWPIVGEEGNGKKGKGKKGK